MKLIVASTSTVYGGKYLDYLMPELKNHFKNIKELLFIPYARPSGMTYDDYTEIAHNAFKKIEINVKGIHEFNSPVEAIKQAQGIFTGGGNTFVLVNKIYELDLWNILYSKIISGIPYLGTSAGSNITGQTMQTTNDMPIVTVKNYKTLGILPFNINPHYLDPAPDLLKHMGETRDTRLTEYLHFNKTPVVALREGSWLEIINNSIFIRGKMPVRIYFSLNDIREIDSNTEITRLFKKNH